MWETRCETPPPRSTRVGRGGKGTGAHTYTYTQRMNIDVVRVTDPSSFRKQLWDRFVPFKVMSPLVEHRPEDKRTAQPEHFVLELNRWGLQLLAIERFYPGIEDGDSTIVALLAHSVVASRRFRTSFVSVDAQRNRTPEEYVGLSMLLTPIAALADPSRPFVAYPVAITTSRDTGHGTRNVSYRRYEQYQKLGVSCADIGPVDSFLGRFGPKPEHWTLPNRTWFTVYLESCFRGAAFNDVPARSTKGCQNRRLYQWIPTHDPSSGEVVMPLYHIRSPCYRGGPVCLLHFANLGHGHHSLCGIEIPRIDTVARFAGLVSVLGSHPVEAQRNADALRRGFPTPQPRPFAIQLERAFAEIRGIQIWENKSENAATLRKVHREAVLNAERANLKIIKAIDEMRRRSAEPDGCAQRRVERVREVFLGIQAPPPCLSRARKLRLERVRQLEARAQREEEYLREMEALAKLKEEERTEAVSTVRKWNRRRLVLVDEEEDEATREAEEWTRRKRIESRLRGDAWRHPPVSPVVCAADLDDLLSGAMQLTPTKALANEQARREAEHTGSDLWSLPSTPSDAEESLVESFFQCERLES